MLSLAVTSSVLAIATVPLSVALLDWLFNARADIHPLAVARIIGISFLLPFLTGVVVRRLSPSTAQRLVTPITNIAATVFLICALVMLGITSVLIIENGVRSFLALTALTVVALVAGHLLGGPKREDRVALAVLCATRHIGLVIVVGFARPSREAVAVLSAYIVAALLVSTPYMAWQRRRLTAEAHPDAPVAG